MGERDPGVAPAPPAPPWRQRAVLFGALAALAAGALVWGPVVAAPTHGSSALLTRLLAVPLAAVAGTRSPALLGVLMLVAAAVIACRSLERRIGEQAPLLLALLIFGSGVWALIWTAGEALVPLALAVAAFHLAYEGGGAVEEPADLYQPPERSWAGALRWLAVGLLLAELLPSGILLAGLLLPVALVVPTARRGVLLPCLLGGFAAGLAVELAMQGAGLLTGPARLAAESISLDPLLLARSLAYLVAGRNIGLIVGFAPLLLLLLLGRSSVGRPALAWVAVGLPILTALLLPFDHASGWLNLQFVAVYGALWHLPGRSPRRWEWAAAVLLCALATWPLWAPPRVALAGGGTGLDGGWPRRVLPYEITLRRLPSHGEARLEASAVRARAVEGCRRVADGGRFEMVRERCLLWLAAPSGLGMVALELGPGAPSSLEVSGATAGRTVFRPDGRVGFELLLDRPRGRHRLWFGARASTLHLIEVRLSEAEAGAPQRFRLLAAAQP